VAHKWLIMRTVQLQLQLTNLCTAAAKDSVETSLVPIPTADGMNVLPVRSCDCKGISMATVPQVPYVHDSDSLSKAYKFASRCYASYTLWRWPSHALRSVALT